MDPYFRDPESAREAWMETQRLQTAYDLIRASGIPWTEYDRGFLDSLRISPGRPRC